MSVRPFAVGIGLPVVQQVPGQAQAWEADAGAAEILQVARAADRLGFAWVSCSDHVAVPASHAPSMGATWYEPSTTLAFVAAATTRIGLLSHVLVLPYRHPLIAAKQFATLDRLSGGRAIIGAGSGHLKAEFRSLGIDHDARAALSDEYLAAIAVALEQEVSSFAGAHVAWRDMLVAPRPLQQPRPPLWVGGNSAAMARRAGRLADGWVPWQISPDDFAAGARLVRQAHAESGRDSSLTLVAPVRAGSVDDPAALAAHLDEWRAHGATAAHLGLSHHSADDLVARLERIASDVLPRLG
ncbi:MAG: TIGR03619 family F420-dependent LLM class oxidoreductase [bacterium]